MEEVIAARMVPPVMTHHIDKACAEAFALADRVDHLCRDFDM
jgi:hypothetical protein